MSVQLIFLFNRDLLIDKKIEKWIWIGSTTIFCIGYFLTINFGQSIKTLPTLMVPLMAYGIYRLMHWSYVKLFNSKPVDTFYTMNIKLMRSGIFNFIFWVAGLLIPILISYELIE